MSLMQRLSKGKGTGVGRASNGRKDMDSCVRWVMKMLSQYAFTTTLVLIGAMVIAGQCNAQTEKDETTTSGVQTAMKIRVTANNKITLFELNNSQAAKDLYAQLPLAVKVENYSDNEKIFYPPKKLNTANTPLADAKTGSLAYYAPWGDVVMFYGNFGSAAGLYALGSAVSGGEHINGMSGTIRIEQVSNHIN